MRLKVALLALLGLLVATTTVTQPVSAEEVLQGVAESEPIRAADALDVPSQTAALVLETLDPEQVHGSVEEIQEFFETSTQGITGRAVEEPSIRTLVTLRPESSEQSVAETNETVASMLEDSGSSVMHAMSEVPVLVVDLTADGFAELQAEESLLGIEIDSPNVLHLAETVPLVGADVATAAGKTGWGNAWTSEASEVAIFDTGVLSAHETFGGRVVAQACFNTGPTCPNGATEMVGPGAGEPCTISAGCFHGTHVAGIAAGESGVAPDAEIISVQVYEPYDGGILAFDSSLIAGLNHIRDRVVNGDQRVASVNMSLGRDRFFGACDTDKPALATAVNALVAVGVVVIASSGNDAWSDSLASPACLTNALAVGNTTNADAVSISSNASPELDLWAPGASVNSANSFSTTSYIESSGTSMSAPHVAGAAAAMFNCINPSNAGPSDEVPSRATAIVDSFTSTGVPVTDGRVAAGVTKPRLDFENALHSQNSNDTFATPEVLVGFDSDTNVCATREAGEPAGTQASVWYEWTADASGTAVLSTCNANTNFDTVVSVYTGTSLTSLAEVASNDNDSSCATSNLHSSVSFVATLGQTYRVRVAGATAFELGQFEISVDYLSTATCAGLVVTVDLGSGDVATAGDDVILGTAGADSIVAGDGNDTVCAGDGDDLVFGGDGNDTIFGEQGADVVSVSYTHLTLPTIYSV